jgi:transcription elongation factor GreA
MDALNVEFSNAPLLAPAEHAAYVRELEALHQIRERDLPRLLRDARTFVASDAAEEIVQIQEDHNVVEARIARLEELLRTARVADDDQPEDIVCLGRTVEVEYLRTGKVASYRVAGIPLASGNGTVSPGSPIGRALMGRAAGDVVEVELPSGRVEDLRVLRVTEDPCSS